MKNKNYTTSDNRANSDTEVLEYLLEMVDNSINNMKNKYAKLQDLYVSHIDESAENNILRMLEKQKRIIDQAIELYTDILGVLACPVSLPNGYISRCFYRIDQLKVMDFEIARKHFSLLRKFQSASILEFSPIASVLY